MGRLEGPYGRRVALFGRLFLATMPQAKKVSWRTRDRGEKGAVWWGKRKWLVSPVSSKRERRIAKRSQSKRTEKNSDFSRKCFEVVLEFETVYDRT